MGTEDVLAVVAVRTKGGTILLRYRILLAKVVSQVGEYKNICKKKYPCGSVRHMVGII